MDNLPPKSGRKLGILIPLLFNNILEVLANTIWQKIYQSRDLKRKQNLTTTTCRSRQYRERPKETTHSYTHTEHVHNPQTQHTYTEHTQNFRINKLL